MPGLAYIRFVESLSLRTLRILGSLALFGDWSHRALSTKAEAVCFHLGRKSSRGLGERILKKNKPKGFSTARKHDSGL